jgi:MYXO-CTERM domain-containing protein
MRRALLLAVLAAPGLAAAQTLNQGQIAFYEGQTDLIHGPWISRAECQAAQAWQADNTKPAAIVNLSWVTQLTNSATQFPGTAAYRIYASNKAIQNNTCYTQGNGTDLNAGQVGETITGLQQSVALEPANIAQILSAAGQLAGCATSSGDIAVYVCVQAFATSDASTIIGVATGQMTLSITPPGSPSGVTAKPADSGALDISWSAPGGSPAAYDYRVTVVNGADPDTHQQTDIRSLSTTVSGLTNDIPYTISVYARSQAGNENATPGTTVATPVFVANFWDVYHTVYKGQEQGGCSSGAAGPIALLGLAALVAKLRRRS